jgi:hypothetical protein
MGRLIDNWDTGIINSIKFWHTKTGDYSDLFPMETMRRQNEVYKHHGPNSAATCIGGKLC